MIPEKIRNTHFPQEKVQRKKGEASIILQQKLAQHLLRITNQTTNRINNNSFP